MTLRNNIRRALNAPCTADILRHYTQSDAPAATRRQVRFPGLVTSAEALGVSRNHLYLVLAGKRVSASLARRYLDLKK